MPHLRCDYSRGLEALVDLEEVGRALHAVMLETGVFPLGGIRVRMHACDLAFVGDLESGNHFLAMELAVGAGREQSVLREAGALVFAEARRRVGALLEAPHFMLSLEIREIEPGLSWKANSVHGRLRG